jgi:hypothetical protein
MLSRFGGVASGARPFSSEALNRTKVEPKSNPNFPRCPGLEPHDNFALVREPVNAKTVR